MPTIDVSTHYTYWHNTESVTYTPYVNGSAGSTVAITSALRRALNRSDVAFGGAYLRGDETVFNLPNAQMSSNEPKPGDTLTDSGSVVWSILRVEKLTFGTRWRCLCQRQR